MSTKRGYVFQVVRAVYRHLPVSQPTKNRLKELGIQAWRTLFVKSDSGTDVSGTGSVISRHTFRAVEPGSRESVLKLRKLFRDTETGTSKSDGYAEVAATSEIEIYHSFAEYMAQSESRAEKRVNRQASETSLLPETDVGFGVEGHCAVCEGQREFSVDFQYAYEKNSDGRLIPNWRESLVCPTCIMNNRVRAAADLLVNQFRMYSQDNIFATEQLTTFYTWLSDQYRSVVGSEYLGDDKVGGELHNNIRHEDITQLSFANDSLDAILSFDVLEHVPDTKSSISEFMRCLKPGGFALISAPFASSNYDTIVRAKLRADGSIEHILDPEYHGNPTKPEEGSLCFYYFGWDLVDQLREAGATDAGVISYYSAEKGNLGPEQLFFLAVK